MQNLGFTSKELFKEITFLLHRSALSGDKIGISRNKVAEKLGFKNSNALLNAFDKLISFEEESKYSNIFYWKGTQRFHFYGVDAGSLDLKSFGFSENTNDMISETLIGNDTYLMDIDYYEDKELGKFCVRGYIEGDIDETSLKDSIYYFYNNWDSYSGEVFDIIISLITRLIAEHDRTGSVDEAIKLISSVDVWNNEHVDITKNLSFIGKGLPAGAMEEKEKHMIPKFSSSDEQSSDDLKSITIKDTFQEAYDQLVNKISATDVKKNKDRYFIDLNYQKDLFLEYIMM
jgi:hypothetical protein